MRAVLAPGALLAAGALLTGCTTPDVKKGDTGSDTDTDTDIDTAPDDTDTGTPFVDPGYTGFAALAEIRGEKSGDPWCDVSVALSGTRQDTLCRDCDFAFAVSSVPTFTTGEEDCLPPVLAAMTTDAHHLDTFLAYDAKYTYSSYYDYTIESVWYVGYTRAYTVMDVDGVVHPHVESRPTRLLLQPNLDAGGGFVVTEGGFDWAGGLEWTQPDTPRLWTDCADFADSDAGRTGIVGEAVVEDVREFESNADRWAVPVAAGSTVSIAVDAVYDGFPGARIYVVRPDGCLGRTVSSGFDCSFDTVDVCPSTEFVANADGDWHIVVTAAGVTFAQRSYRLGVQVDGLDVTPTLVDDDATLYDRPTYTGEATITGEWHR